MGVQILRRLKTSYRASIEYFRTSARANRRVGGGGNQQRAAANGLDMKKTLQCVEGLFSQALGSW
jgi:hypothetical protein